MITHVAQPATPQLGAAQEFEMIAAAEPHVKNPVCKIKCMTPDL